MRRSGIIIVAAAAALAPGLAHAADLEVVKAEPTIYVPNNFLWSGVYVGGFVGGGWGTADWGPGSITVTLPTGTSLTPPLIYLSKVNVPISGFVGGGRVGANYQAGPFVFGFEGDFTGMTLKGHATIAFSDKVTVKTITVEATGTTAYQTTADWAATFTGRVGYTFDRILAYGKVGMAVEQDGDTEVSNTTLCKVTDTSTSPPTTHTCTGLTRSGTATRYGWTAGAGLEYAFDKHWSAFAEYDHLGFLSQLVNLTVPGSSGTVTPARLIGLNIDRVVGGANYRF